MTSSFRELQRQSTPISSLVRSVTLKVYFKVVYLFFNLLIITFYLKKNMCAIYAKLVRISFAAHLRQLNTLVSGQQNMYVFVWVGHELEKVGNHWTIFLHSLY